jgi:tRNA (cmo5U34)-methyltransferase
VLASVHHSTTGAWRGEVEVLCEDLVKVEVRQASIAEQNFTLQFIPREARAGLLQRIYAGMLPGGVLILSEKIEFADSALNDLFVDAYHVFKERMGYSSLEISRKRTALETVLIPETLDCHRQRLQQAGFRSVDTWFQCFNFASLVAIK